MSLPVNLENPLGWVHLQLAGGVRRTAMIILIYVAAVVLFCFITFRSIAATEHLSLSRFASGALSVMTLISGAILFIGGPGSIKKAIHRDYQADMITSHRLTAMSGYTAVIGYLTGPTAAVLALTAVNWLICSLLAILAKQPIYGPTIMFGVFGCLALTFWVLGVLTGLASRGVVASTGLIVVLLFLGNTPAISLVPGLRVFLGATSFFSMFGQSGPASMGVPMLVGLFAQLALSLAFFIAAARKYARDDVIAFTPTLALSVLAICCIMGSVPLRFWPTAQSNVLNVDYTPIQCIATLTVLALLSVLPIACITRHAARWNYHKARNANLSERRPIFFWVAPLLATGIVFGILAIILPPVLPELLGEPSTPRTELLTASLWLMGVFALALLPIAGLLRWVYSFSTKSAWPLVFFFTAIWIIPPLADMALRVAQASGPHDPHSALLTCSPVGMWMVILGLAEANLTVGLVIHVIIAAIGIALPRLAKR